MNPLPVRYFPSGNAWWTKLWWYFSGSIKIFIKIGCNATPNHDRPSTMLYRWLWTLTVIPPSLTSSILIDNDLEHNFQIHHFVRPVVTDFQSSSCVVSSFLRTHCTTLRYAKFLANSTLKTTLLVCVIDIDSTKEMETDETNVFCSGLLITKCQKIKDMLALYRHRTGSSFTLGAFICLNNL